MPEDQLPGLCWACEWAMKKLKKQLGNNANEVSEKHHAIQVKTECNWCHEHFSLFKHYHRA